MVRNERAEAEAILPVAHLLHKAKCVVLSMASEVINPPLPTILKEKTKVFFFLCRGLDENHEKWFEREPAESGGLFVNKRSL